MADLIDGLMTIVMGFFLPASGTLSPIHILLWFGFMFGAIVALINLIKRLATSGGRR